MRVRRDSGRSAKPSEQISPKTPTRTQNTPHLTPTDARISSAIKPESSPRSDWLFVLGLFVVTFLAYWPCVHGELVWDDDAWTLKLQGLFQNLAGLGQIWTNVTALQQYYPLSATTFWIDYHLWGFWTTPYHVENILLHLAATVLFWHLLRRLKVPGAGLAAAVLALHPMMVESVAWITERKNVLSLVLYLGALHAYGRFNGFWKQASTVPGETKKHYRQRSWYLIALLLFLAAELAKATAFSLPAVILLVGWWKNGRVRSREDIIPTVPFWTISIGLGLLTAWLERTHVGARGPDWDISFLERCLIAGRALWFYAGQLLWPTGLCFIYPRWDLNTASVRQWLWPVAALLVVSGLWLTRRRIGRSPLAAVLFFAGTLFPLLGFFNGYFMRYSFVCDHWCYLSSLGFIALGAATVTRLADQVGHPELIKRLIALLLLPLGVLTCAHAAIFADAETLYRVTLARNPNADLAHNNLGLLLAQAGQLEEAIAHLQKAVELRPASAHAHNNLANAYRATGRWRDAEQQYELSLRLEPDDARTCSNLAFLLATSSEESLRNGQRALELAQRANQLTHGNNPIVLATLAAAYAETGRFTNAVSAIQQAAALVPANSSMSDSLQSQLSLFQQGLPFREPVINR